MLPQSTYCKSLSDWKPEHQLYFTHIAISTEKNKNKYIFNGEYYDWERIQKVGFSTLTINLFNSHIC